jgi:hypothetical protein
MIWTNTITNSHPLIFHFAGNDWLCACQILATGQYPDMTTKFANSCQQEFPRWQARVNHGIEQVSHATTSPDQQLFLQPAAGNNNDETVVLAVNRQLQGYGPSAPASPPTLAPVQSPADCAIVQFDLWNGETDMLSVSNMVNGSAFCSSTYPVAIQAVGEPCVRNVRFRLASSGGYSFKSREFVPPYFLFGNSGTFINGRIMRPGNYTLTATPNRGKGKAANLFFYVDNC